MSKFIVPAHALALLKHVPKVGKFIAEIEFHGRTKLKFWVSENQAKAIRKAFGEALDEALDGKRYSTKANQAYVILESITLKDGRPGFRLIWAVANRPNAEKSAKYFGADWGWPGENNDSEGGA